MAGNRKFVKSDPIPELLCLQKPRRGTNDGVYEITIPIKYLIKAVEVPAAFYKFKFIGLLYKEE